MLRNNCSYGEVVSAALYFYSSESATFGPSFKGRSSSLGDADDLGHRDV